MGDTCLRTYYVSAPLTLTVVGPRAMLAKVVLIEQRLLHRTQPRRERQRVDRHRRHRLERNGVLHRVRGILPPSKWSMPRDQHRRHRDGIEIGKPLDNYPSRVEFV